MREDRAFWRSHLEDVWGQWVSQSCQSCYCSHNSQLQRYKLLQRAGPLRSGNCWHLGTLQSSSTWGTLLLSLLIRLIVFPGQWSSRVCAGHQVSRGSSQKDFPSPVFCSLPASYSSGTASAFCRIKLFLYLCGIWPTTAVPVPSLFLLIQQTLVLFTPVLP